MLVVHGTWAYGAPLVWAEDSGLPAQAPPRPGRPSRAPRPHPFAAPAGALARALAAVLAGGPAGSFARALPGQAADDEVTLHLPSTASGPAASPELLVQPTAGGAAAGRLSLAAWRVPVLYFEPAAALSLLAALARLAPGDVVASPSIGYLGAAARFADDLAARGRVLPALAAEDGGYRARWRPVLSAADARHARELAAAMPPACRALAGSEHAGWAGRWRAGRRRAGRRGRGSRAGTAVRGHARRADRCLGARPPARSPAARAQRPPPRPHRSSRTDAPCPGRPAVRDSGDGRGRRGRRARPGGRVRGLAVQRSAPGRLGPHLLPPSRAAARRRRQRGDGNHGNRAARQRRR